MQCMYAKDTGFATEMETIASLLFTRSNCCCEKGKIRPRGEPVVTDHTPSPQHRKGRFVNGLCHSSVVLQLLLLWHDPITAKARPLIIVLGRECPCAAETRHSRRKGANDLPLSPGRRMYAQHVASGAESSRYGSRPSRTGCYRFRNLLSVPVLSSLDL